MGPNVVGPPSRFRVAPPANDQVAVSEATPDGSSADAEMLAVVASPVQRPGKSSKIVAGEREAEMLGPVVSGAAVVVVAVGGGGAGGFVDAGGGAVEAGAGEVVGTAGAVVGGAVVSSWGCVVVLSDTVVVLVVVVDAGSAAASPAATPQGAVGRSSTLRSGTTTDRRTHTRSSTRLGVANGEPGRGRIDRGRDDAVAAAERSDRGPIRTPEHGDDDDLVGQGDDALRLVADGFGGRGDLTDDRFGRVTVDGDHRCTHAGRAGDNGPDGPRNPRSDHQFTTR